MIADWYTREPSQYYRKNVYNAKINGFVIEGSQYGDLLALSNATFLQGTPKSPYCAQSFVFGFQQIYPQSSTQVLHSVDNPDNFSLGSFTTVRVWRYRRLVGNG